MPWAPWRPCAALRPLSVSALRPALRVAGCPTDREVEHLLELYRELRVSEEARLAAYRRLFEDALSAELLQRLRDCANGGFVLGTAKFERQIATILIDRRSCHVGRRIA